MPGKLTLSKDLMEYPLDPECRRKEVWKTDTVCWMDGLDELSVHSVIALWMRSEDRPAGGAKLWHKLVQISESCR